MRRGHTVAHAVVLVGVCVNVAWWLILVCWIFTACAIRSQQEFVSGFHPNHHDDRGKLLRMGVIASALLAALVSLVLAYLHYTSFGVLWTLVLLAVGGVAAAAIWGALSALVGDRLLALASFLVWPVSALSTFLLLGLASK